MKKCNLFFIEILCTQGGMSSGISLFLFGLLLTTKEIVVGLGKRAYPIVISQGLLNEVGVLLKRLNSVNRYVVISDSRVAGLFGEQLMQTLESEYIKAELVTFPKGEESKNFTTIATLASTIARLGIDRKDGLIALGGGVTGDITGFLASSYMRGIPFIQIPTTLLAQVDSSVGGKTGVDIPEGKNLVGAFYQPRSVYIDSTVLLQLPKTELLNGLAEVIKYSVIHDQEFFKFLERNRDRILDLDLPVLEEIIEICCKIKAYVVATDERESDLRRILNFGHTIGHAIEAASNYIMAHGSAVAIGMVAAGKLAVLKGLFDEEDFLRMNALIKAYDLPTEIPLEIDTKEIKKYLKTDKKAVGGRPFFVLPIMIGKVTINDDITENLLDQVL